jgi:nucleotide-binding universal stress UspA family protein
MNTKTILVPTDFSKLCQASLDYATGLARDMKARLVIMHVQEPPAAYGGGEMYYGIPEPDDTELQRMLGELKPNDPAVPFEHRLVAGDPAAEIVAMAEELRSELIVLPTHGRTGLTRLLMGSVAESVVRSAPCPVLTFRRPETVTPLSTAGGAGAAR